MKGYCVKCKDKDGKEMKDVEVVQTKKGGWMAKGKCTDCGCGMCKMMSKDQADQLKEELSK